MAEVHYLITAEQQSDLAERIRGIQHALFVAADILNGDRDPSREDLTLVQDAAEREGYDLGWAWANMKPLGLR